MAGRVPAEEALELSACSCNILGRANDGEDGVRLVGCSGACGRFDHGASIRLKLAKVGLPWPNHCPDERLWNSHVVLYNRSTHGCQAGFALKKAKLVGDNYLLGG